MAQWLNGQRFGRYRQLIYPNPRYRTFTIKKKNGETREITAPAEGLKAVQRRLASMLLIIYGRGKPSVHSFMKGRNIVSNAAAHTKGKRFVFNVDIEDFFPSINFGRVMGVFRSPPFSFPRNVAAILAQTCCFNRKLPQGAPTSPIIANFICRALDTDLQVLAMRSRATYTRYCDDITFSFSRSGSSHLPESIVVPTGVGVTSGLSLKTLFDAHSFKLNERKIRLRSRSNRMEVTGLTVNEFPNVNRRRIHEVRGMLHVWEKYGLASAEARLKDHYKRQLSSKRIPKFERVLKGKLAFLKMVRGADDKIFARLADRFNNLLSRDAIKDTKPLKLALRPRTLAELERSIFVLECYIDNGDGTFAYSQGTAFLLHGVGLITCEHILRRDDRAKKEEDIEYCVATKGDKVTISNRSLGILEKEVAIQAVYLTEDLAVLTTPAGLPNGVLPLPLRIDVASVKEPVLLAGYPDHNPAKPLSIIDTRVLSNFPKFAKRHLEVATNIRKGFSGGPVLDVDYYVVGLAKEGATQEKGTDAALASDEIRKTLGLI
jgi:RNA-directed DNA polymerase